jgi:16S rRNA (uracil1498-N3)-methyltransferase
MFISTTYFYAPPEKFSKGKVFLDDEESHHITNVLRGKPGDNLVVSNGIGDTFKCRIEKTFKNCVVATVSDIIESRLKPNIDLTLGMGIVRPKQIETALDWSIQLGISAFMLLKTDFTIRDWSNNDKLKRLEKVAIRSIKQCKRAWLPEIFPLIDLTEFLIKNGKNFEGIIYTDPSGLPAPPKRMIQSGSRIVVLVGPEGGFSRAEQTEFARHGAVPLSLGPARLRAETAAVTAVSKIFIWSGNI